MKKLMLFMCLSLSICGFAQDLEELTKAILDNQAVTVNEIVINLTPEELANASKPTPDHSLRYTIEPKRFRFLTEYEMTTNNDSIGRVETPRNLWNLRTNYDLYNKVGEKEANGKFALFNPSAWSRWWGDGCLDIEVVDARGTFIGYIDGELLTTAKAKFSFYNAESENVGVAYLDDNCAGFTVTNPLTGVRLAHLKREFVIDAVDHWTVLIPDVEKVDARLIKIFSAFVVDIQGKFKQDR